MLSSIIQRTLTHRNLLQRAAAPSSITPRNNGKPSLLLALGCNRCWNIKTLCLFGSTMRCGDSIEFELVKRKHAVKVRWLTQLGNSCEETSDPVWSSKSPGIALLHDLQGTVMWLCDNQGAQSMVWLSQRNSQNHENGEIYQPRSMCHQESPHHMVYPHTRSYDCSQSCKSCQYARREIPNKY